MHDIENQITYPGSNFIFHDSMGFESGGALELETAWEFIKQRSSEAKLKDQLHAIWYLFHLVLVYLTDKACRYCIPMDSPRPILSSELQFFEKGTGKGKSKEQYFYLLFMEF